MSDLDVGKKVTYHSEYGPLVGWVADYVAGKDEGDHLIWGPYNQAGREAGQGNTYSVWSVVGSEQGAFTIKH